MPKAILTLNAGSSSIKFALYELGVSARHLLSHGQIEGIGTAPRFVVRAPNQAKIFEHVWPATDHLDHESLLTPLLTWVTAHLGQEALVGVGHRVVHGGDVFDRPVRVDQTVLNRLESLIPLAPLHQPHNLAAIKAMHKLQPDVAQVACFDTAFHRSMSSTATRLAIPRNYAEEGVRRYGFHGISYEYIIGRFRELEPIVATGKVIAAHLGNGASLCAMSNGRSVDTTMGFTALDGLMMGTRCGSLDPGVVLYLQQAHGLTAAQVEYMLYHSSGLLGVSGISNDMRTLLASADLRARQAIDLFVFRIVREIGALAASLGGLDALIFSAGIGEHAPAIRAAVCERLGWLGVAYDEDANGRNDFLISTAPSAVRVCVVATDEEAMMAEHVTRLLFSSERVAERAAQR